MKVKIIKTGEVKTVNDSYGLRMLTQGQAVLSKGSSSANKRKSAKTAGEE